MLEGSCEPALYIAFSPDDAAEVRMALRGVERFVAINQELCLLVEELQQWETENAGSDRNRGEPSVRIN
jgi:hypothetical protein